jgi:hypothetical protein
MPTVSKIAADERLEWFLERVPLIWLLLTVVTIAAVLDLQIGRFQLKTNAARG